jgi:hypothetical protein
LAFADGPAPAQAWPLMSEADFRLPGGSGFMLSIVKGIKPRDELETMLAAQMAAVHMAAPRSGKVILQPVPQAARSIL